MKQTKKQRGVFEKVLGSGVWWIRYADALGRIRREKAGAKSTAIHLYRKRKQGALEGRKLPEKLRVRTRPTLKEFSERFMQAVRTRCAAKPRTIIFYARHTKYILAFESIANRPLDEIDEAIIEKFSQSRRLEVSVATTNRGLAVLRRMLRLAHEWRILDRIPRIHLLRGERNREFVLNREQERIYLDFAPQLLRDVAVLMVDSALGPAEALALEWTDIHWEPITDSPFGYLQVREGKTQYRARSLSLTSRVHAMLKERKRTSQSEFVFAEGNGKPPLPTSLAHMHARLRKQLKMPAEFVLYCLRHTALTRFGDEGADAFTIMRIAGHSSVTTSQRYVHPSSEAVGRAVARLESANQRAEVLAQRTDTRTDTELPPWSVSH